jgi:O-antigen ligase
MYLVLEYNRPQTVYPVIDIIPWGKTILGLAVALALMEKKSKRPPMAAVVPMVGFSICVLLSSVFAFSTSIAVEKWMDFFGWVFVVFLLTSVVRTRTRLLLFIGVYFLVNLKMAQHGFRTWALRGFGYESWGVSGSPGWFQNSGEFSMEMAVFLPLVLTYIAIFRMEWSRSVRMFFYLLAIMAIGSIIASASRGAVLGLVMVGLWGLAYSRQRVKALIAVFVGATLISMAMPPELKQRFETIGKDDTSFSRLSYWEYGKEAVRNNPLTGIGFRNWTSWVIKKHPEVGGVIGSGDRVEVIHNTYLEVATELGFLGAAVYSFILVEIFVINLRSARRARLIKDRFLTATAVGLNGSLVVYLVPSYFMSVLYYPYIWMLLAITVCLSTICKKEVENQSIITKSKARIRLAMGRPL